MPSSSPMSASVWHLRKSSSGAKQSSTWEERLRAFDLASASLALVRCDRKTGRAIAARIPMIRITTSTSMSVKPLSRYSRVRRRRAIWVRPWVGSSHAPRDEPSRVRHLLLARRSTPSRTHLSPWAKIWTGQPTTIHCFCKLAHDPVRAVRRLCEHVFDHGRRDPPSPLPPDGRAGRPARAVVGSGRTGPRGGSPAGRGGGLGGG